MSLLKRISEPGTGPLNGGTGPLNDGGAPAGTTRRLGTGPLGGAGSSALPQRPGTAPLDRSAIREPDLARAAEIRRKVQELLIETLDPRVDTNNTTLIQRQIDEILTSVLDGEGMVLSRSERARLLEMILHDIIGLGPLEDLLADPDISEIMVNGPKQIYIESKGKLQKVATTFLNDEHALRIIDRIIAPLGRRVDELSPMVDARLKDGSRVNIIIRPISLLGPVITIRKFAKERITIDDLIRFGTVTSEMSDFLNACIKARLNLVVSGGTGSGKTTTLNILSSFIPDDERIITIENAAELQLRQDHVVTLESRPPSVEGTGEVTMMDLIVNALRMRPDRIIVGECRGGETLAMLQAMNTGHDGSLTTLHANSPRDAIARIETMCLMAGMDLPIRAIREQTASAVDVIIQQTRLKDGSRKIISITEVMGMEGDIVQLQDIFVFDQTGVDEQGKVIGRLRPTGVRPRFIEKFEASAIYLPPGIFGSSERFG
jgi:pilus assembly protein CpaF